MNIPKRLSPIPNTSDEPHAFLIGFFEILCPWKPQHHDQGIELRYIKDEYHYYLAGRGIGFIILLLILIGIAKLTKVLLL